VPTKKVIFPPGPPTVALAVTVPRGGIYGLCGGWTAGGLSTTVTPGDGRVFEGEPARVVCPGDVVAPGLLPARVVKLGDGVTDGDAAGVDVGRGLCEFDGDAAGVDGVAAGVDAGALCGVEAGGWDDAGGGDDTGGALEGAGLWVGGG
jgi:hypothetical protein